MLPGGVLAKKQLTKLKFIQRTNILMKIKNPKEIEFDKFKQKNIIKKLMENLNNQDNKKLEKIEKLN